MRNINRPARHARQARHARRGRIARILIALGAMASVMLGTGAAFASDNPMRPPLNTGLILHELAVVQHQIHGHHFRTFTVAECFEWVTAPGTVNRSLVCGPITISETSVSMSWGNSAAAQTFTAPNRTLPPWLRVSNVFNDHSCHLPGHNFGKAVIVWSVKGNTSAVHCAGPPLGNGKAFTS